MRLRPSFWIVLGLLLLVGAWFFWLAGDRRAAEQNSVAPQKIAAQKKSAVAPDFTTAKSAATAPQLFTAGKNATNAISSTAKTNQFPYRLSNTTKPIGELLSDGRAVLLANAFIDTGARLNFSIPKHLAAAAAPGAYIVQSRTPMDAAYRAQLAAAGAEIVSYIPNNAYLVRMSAAGAAEMAGKPATSAVLPYEPYYKISASLLGAAVEQKSLPGDAVLTLGLFANNAAQTIDIIKQLGGTVLATDRSPFGPMVRVLPPPNWTALAVLTGVQIVEPSRQRATANDLARVSLGISTDTVTNANYGGLTGSNVLVAVIDSGIDATHPDFTTGGNPTTAGGAPIRVTGVSPVSITDTSGHGTHVAGIIAGNGSKSYSVTATPQGSVTNADFRGKAPAAKLFSVAALNNKGTLDVSDSYLQSAPATNNALISNNSWNYSGDNTYDLAAASYDAAVRDALPLEMGSQPVLFVFAAGNDGGGNEDGGGGSPDTVLSPGTAKNVITVGALEQLRNITNEVADLAGNTNAAWSAATDSGFQVASYSARGNVGIGTEGTYGRFKPDVVAPGTFVVSTRSQQWDQIAYYNPTNYYFNAFTGQVVVTNSLNYYNLSVPGNAVGVKITIVANANSPVPFPNLPIYVKQSGFPTTTSYDFVTTVNAVSIPPDGGGGYLQTIQNSGFVYAVGNSTNFPVSYNLITEITTTNDAGNYFLVLSNLNDTLGPYRYESGTSMAAPAVSGTLALMQDYFTNTLHATPSPALLKAMLINGARAVGNYNFLVTNSINFQGWGLASVPNSVPSGITNQLNAPCASFFTNQSPANALATGDSETFTVTVSSNATVQPLRVTLAWTDPPGDPAAATKLVNNLDLIVTNLATGEVYYGNDIPRGSTFNAAWNTNLPPNLDAINNVENVFLSSADGGNYTVTVIGRGVNVNAVTAQTNNVVQDYALVISSGDGGITNALTVTTVTLASHLTDAQLVTFVGAVNAPLLNQLVGASTPLLGTNTIPTGTNAAYATNAVITLGMTNQWHFYVVTNTTTFTNAAFITFLPATLSLPRMGVFAATEANATRPEADIDLYVTTDSSLTNLNPAAIAGADKSLSRGGTEFVAYTDSTQGKVYYIGVQSQDQAAAEYGFLPVFSQQPFSQMVNGNEIVNGLLLPVNIPDGSPQHPGVAYVFALALQAMQVREVIVSNEVVHQNFGDLIGVLDHSGKNAVLNNHASLFNANGVYTNVYNDAGNGLFPGSHPTDGPGSLNNFQGQQAVGPWIMTMVDDSLTQTGAVTAFSLLIKPHNPLNNPGVQISVQPGEFFVDYIDVPAGAINLTVSATNLFPTTGTPLQLYVKPFTPPTRADTNNMVLLINGVPPGNSISTGPPLVPGRYFVGIYNPDAVAHDVWITASLLFSGAAKTTVDFNSAGNEPIVDDAVSYSSIFVPNTDVIQSFQVGLRVDHPRISDLVFHLISPDGTRYLLMENRGALSTNGCGVTIITTNFTPVSSSGGAATTTNFVDVGKNSGPVTINWDFFTIPDMMDVYYEGVPVFSSGLVSFTGSTVVNFGPGASTQLEVVMNATNHPANTFWTYTVGGVQTNYYYLAFTEDTNRTTTPIKFAPPPFVPGNSFATNFVLSNFESAAAGNYVAPATVDGWNVVSNQVSVVNDATTAYQGNNFLALANGTISNTLPTVAGQTYTLTFAYRGPNIIGLWRGEGNANDSVGTNNGVAINGVTYNAGMVGQAFNFNSAHSAVILGDPDDLKLTNSFSIEGWVNPRANSGIALIFFRGDTRGCLDPYYLAGYYGSSGPSLHVEGTANICGVNVAPSPPSQLPINQWTHVAGTFDGITGIMRVYTNGVLVAQLQTAERPFRNLDPNSVPGVAIGNLNSGNLDMSFNGLIDELSVYKRPLSASEVKAIFQNGSAGKYNAAVEFPQNLAEAAVNLQGNNPATLFGANTNWQTYTATFVATQNGTPLAIAGLEPGMLLDAFSLRQVPVPGNLYYQPEQDISGLTGTSAHGLWQLEILDDRAGAGLTNTLVSWQLEMIFANTNSITPTLSLTNGLSQTNTIPANSTAWYLITVPTNADFATNTLLFATAPVNLLFNQIAPVTNGDYTLLLNATNGSSVLSTTSAPTNIVPGATYYLGVQNTNSFAVTYAIEVDFHLIPLTNVPPPIFISSIIHTNGGFLLIWFAPTNDIFQVQYTDSLAPVNWQSFTNIIPYTGPPTPTNGMFTFFDDGSQTPPGLPPIRFYRLILLGSESNLTNGLPQTNTVAPGSTAFFLVNVPTNADFATNTLIFASAPLNLLFNQATLPTGTNAGGYTLLTNSTGGVSILSASTVPPLVPGATYYLGVQNTNSFPVNFALQVNFHLLAAPSVYPITSIIYTNIGGTNGFLLTWLAPTNDIFQVQVATNLASPIVWQTFTNIITYAGPPTPTNGWFSFFDDGTQIPFGPLRFYRLILLGVAPTNTLTLPLQTNFTIAVSSAVTVTNTAVDSRTNAVLTYSLVTAPAGSTISSNGIITWTNATPAGLAARFTTVVTDDSLPPLTASNTFTIFVTPMPSISGITVTTNGLNLTWLAPTNDQFQVQWTTNLAPPSWTLFPGIITSTNGIFSFTDTNAPSFMKFYELLLLP